MQAMGISLLLYQTPPPHPKDSHAPPIWYYAMCFFYYASACVCVKQIITVVHKWESIGRDSESRCQRLYSDKIIWTLPCKRGSGRVGGNTGSIHPRKWVGAEAQDQHENEGRVSLPAQALTVFSWFLSAAPLKNPQH